MNFLLVVNDNCTYTISNNAPSYFYNQNPFPQNYDDQEKLLPHQKDSIIIGYSKEELIWAKSNELYIWKYFVEKEILYKTDSRLIRRFIDPSPFSKFYLEIDNNSPGIIGRWVGWQIVKSYMKRNPNTNIEDLISKPSEELFIKSAYKPKL